ncbi:Retrovirus-related Pol polyprotein from transposon TNT 1-94 [Orchesella cincta]|uniref:Retrovirus-related Pol polyprotein from transposon TNT 1-94 n=1 Tax=Orchesella cincta TaxID=48709 RepID=A0A1D2M4Z4_ORCCI|nr:Retrovirus-related Pol polyprotein from transposon TNT 1-94 [Orchesella cincta]
MTKSLGGTRYMMVTLDQKSNFIYVSFLKEKAAVVTQIPKIVSFFETQTGNPVKMIRSDNAKEFTSKFVEDFMAEKGIIHGLSPPYCPQQNGKAERQMRRIKDLATTLLKQSGLEDSFWAEASYYHIPKEQRRPWEPKAKRGYLVGFDASTNYRVYCVETRTVKIVHDVSFNEQYIKYVTVSHDEASAPSFEGKTESESDAEDVDDDEEQDFRDAEENSTTATHATASNTIIHPIPLPPPRLSNSRTPRSSTSTVKVHLKTPDGTYEAQSLKARHQPKLKPTERYGHFSTPVPEPSTYNEAITSADADKWVDSMNDELNSLAENQTWQIVDAPANAKILDSRWVYRVKRNPDGSIARYKSRLVIRGYLQEKGIDFHETFANVARLESIRLLLAIAVKMGYHISTLDVITAFLQGELNEVIYMAIPQGLPQKKNKVCLLQRPLYGLRQAPRQWNEKLTTVLKMLGFHPSASDPSDNIRSKGEQCYVVIYVDDLLLISSCNVFMKQLQTALKAEFKLKETACNSFVGIQFESLADGSIFLHNTKFVAELLETFRMNDSKPTSVPMQPNAEFPIIDKIDAASTIPYREGIGSLLFLSRTCRPDINYAGTKTTGILYDSDDKNMLISGFSDSDYASSKEDRKSTYRHSYSFGLPPITIVRDEHGATDTAAQSQPTTDDG